MFCQSFVSLYLFVSAHNSGQFKKNLATSWPLCGKTQVPGTKYHTTFVMVFKLESATSPAVEFEFTIVREFVRFS
jgi:hypothetical protein